jgi:hypothetical protein
MTRSLLRDLCFLVPPALSVPVFALVLPHWRLAMADALLGMVSINVLLLLPGA